jgi:uncharacterized protein with PIN domain
MIADAMLGALARWLRILDLDDRVYWRGTHVERMARRMERMGI